MNKLTKREKILLYLLAAVAIIAGGFLLLIQPQLETVDELDSDILTKQSQLSEMEAELSQFEVLDDAVAVSRDDVLEATEKFLPMMTNNALDRYITGLLQSKGLTSLSLVMTENATSDYVSNSVVVSKIEVTASGTLPQFISLVKTATETDGLRVSACTLVQDEPLPTSEPTPTPKPARGVKVTPVPADFVATPVPTPVPPTYTMQITFLAAQCDVAYVNSVLDMEE